MSKKISINEALMLCAPWGKAFGKNCIHIGEFDHYLSLRLSTNGSSGSYGLLCIKCILNGQTVDNWSYDLTDLKYAPKERRIMNISSRGEGGYYWSYDNKWYNWNPTTNGKLHEDIKKLQKFVKL